MPKKSEHKIVPFSITPNHVVSSNYIAWIPTSRSNNNEKNYIFDKKIYEDNNRTNTKKRLPIKFHQMEYPYQIAKWVQSKRELINIEKDILLRRERTKIMRMISNHFLMTEIKPIQKIIIYVELLLILISHLIRKNHRYLSFSNRIQGKQFSFFAYNRKKIHHNEKKIYKKQWFFK